MPPKNSYQDRIDLMQRTLDMLVLCTLQWRAQHGHGIRQAIRAKSEEAPQIEYGSLYPALHRLEERGLLKAEWKVSEANRRARYFSLTPAGKRQFIRKEFKWNAILETIARVMKPA